MNYKSGSKYESNNESNNESKPEKHIGYKQIKYGKIVELEIIGDHNENRSTMVNPLYAKMRCSKANVLDIYSIDDPSKKFKNGMSIYDSGFMYDVGKTVSTKYDPNENNICTGGIHYYLNRESAIGNVTDCLKNYTGYVIKAHDSGESPYRMYFINGNSVLGTEYYYQKCKLPFISAFIFIVMLWLYLIPIIYAK